MSAAITALPRKMAVPRVATENTRVRIVFIVRFLSGRVACQAALRRRLSVVMSC